MESTGDLRPDRYPQVVKQIENDPQWQAIDAVKHHRVWLMPEYAKAWGYLMPEALALGELWMAKNSILCATRASMWTVKPGLLSAFLPRGVDARCPLTLSPGWCREAWRWRRWRSRSPRSVSASTR